MKYHQKFYLGPNFRDPSLGAKILKTTILIFSTRLGPGKKPKKKLKWSGTTAKKD